MLTKSDCSLSIIDERIVKHTTKSFNYDARGRYVHAWRDTNFNQEVNSLQSDRVTRYKCPTSGHVLVFSGSSETRRLNDNRKKELAKLAAVENGRPLGRNKKDKLLPASEALLFSDDEFEPNAANALEKCSRRTLQKFSPKSAARIRNYAQCFARAGARSFITLTFLNAVDDKKAMRCFSAYMQNWRISGKQPHYIAVMERQENNKVFFGNAHFHIMVRDFVDIDEENTRWVRVQYNNGVYLRKGENDVYTRQEVEAAAQNNLLPDWLCKQRGLLKVKNLANPFDIKKIDDAAGAAFYITKYISKSVKTGTEYGCKPWSCSVSISKMYKTALCIPELFDVSVTDRNIIERKKDWVNKDTGEVIKAAGSKITPIIIENFYATTVSIVNKKYFHAFLKEMDEINTRFLDTGILEAAREISWDEYYNQYCRKYTVDEIALSREPVDKSSEDRYRIIQLKKSGNNFADFQADYDIVKPDVGFIWHREQFEYNGMRHYKYTMKPIYENSN